MTSLEQTSESASLTRNSHGKYGDIGECIQRTMDERGILCSDLVNHIVPRAKLKRITLRTYIGHIRRGNFNHQSPEFFETLGQVLYSCEILPDDRILSQIREKKPDFTYPPKNAEVLSHTSRVKHVYRELGDKIRIYFRTVGISPVEISRQVNKVFNVREVSALNSISDILKGRLFSRKKDDHGNYTYQRRKNACFRLSHVLYTAGISENHNIISEIREIERSFKYPPEGGIRYDPNINSNNFFDSKMQEDNLDVRRLLQLDPKNYKVVSGVIYQLYKQQKALSSQNKKNSGK